MSSEAIADPPVEEITQEELERKLKLQLVDVSHGVAANARDAADEYINEQTRGGGIKGFAKRIWYGNLARDFIRHRHTQQGREEIVESGNLYALSDASQAEHDNATRAIVDRFTSEYDLLHQNETNESFEDSERGAGLQNQIKQLVSEYASGSIGMDALIEERTRILNEYGSHVHESDRNKGLLYADNIIEVAQNAKLAFEHGIALERIDAALSGSVGEARVGVRTEARRENVDKIVDRLYKSRVGSLVNETTIVGAASLVMNLAKVSTQKATTAAGATIGMGVGAGVIAGAREHYRYGQERQLHMRQMAEGGQMAEGSKRRGQLETTRYETVSAQDLIDGLASSSEAANLVGETDPARLQELVFHISRAESMVSMSDERSLDLITFSSKTSVESERLDLDIALARAKIALQKILETTPREQLNAAGIRSTNPNAILMRTTEAIEMQASKDIDRKDAVFRKLRRQQTAKMAVIGAATGMAIGTGVQEAKSLVDGGLNGIFTSPDNPDRDTLLTGIFGDRSEGSVGKSGDQGPWHLDRFNEDRLHNGGLQLPEGYKLDADGHSIIGPEGKPVVGGLEWNKDGQLSDSSIAALKERGFGVSDHAMDYTHHRTVSEEVRRLPEGFFEGKHKGFERVHRELWYDNNTPAPVFDQNELRMDWGSGGSGITEKGNYVFSVSRMTPDGSFHGEFSADAKELAREGKLAVALSMTKDSQQFVEIIKIDENGNAIIDKDSIAGQSMFEKENGHAKFVGAYAETVQIVGDGKDGVHTKMLATVVGENDPNKFTETITHTESEKREYHITHIDPPEAEPNDVPVEIPPVIPVYGRRGLEELSSNAPNYYYNSYNAYNSGDYVGGGVETTRRYAAPFAPELANNPDADIDANVVAKRYFDSIRPSRKRRIDQLTKKLEGQPKADKPRVVVMIPAAAHQEGKNIYRTLMQYAKQKDVDQNEFEVVVFANRPKGSKKDKTASEIQRFQREHPEIKVRIVEEQLEPDEAKMGWIRKAMTDAVLSDLMNRGVDLNEVLMVSNDADSEWINPRYLATILEKAEAQPDVDGFLGYIDWSYDAYKARPELLVGTRFMQMIEIRNRIISKAIGSSGANFVFRPRAYTAVGGYDTTTPLGEDVVLGRMIKGMRSGAQTHTPIAFLGRSAEVNTSARRALENLFRHGSAPSSQWNYGFGTDDALRTKDFGLENFDYDDPDAVARLVSDTERVLNQTLADYLPHMEQERPQYQSNRLGSLSSNTVHSLEFMLGVIGVKVRWQPDGSFKITDASRMIHNLRKWQAAH